MLRVRSLDVIDAAFFDHFNVHITKSGKDTSKRRANRMYETVNRVPVTMNDSWAIYLPDRIAVVVIYLQWI